MALPLRIRTPWLSRRVAVFWERCSLMSSMRSFKASTSTSGRISSRPIPRSCRPKVIAPPVAIIVFEGMQSRRWAAPPTISRSTTVTSAPRRAAYVAAMLPAGPPPMTRKRTAMPKGYPSILEASLHVTRVRLPELRSERFIQILPIPSTSRDTVS